MSERSYIVRVYRRRENRWQSPARRGTDRVRLDGIVEEPKSGERTSFHGVEELWRALARKSGRRSGKRVGETS